MKGYWRRCVRGVQGRCRGDPVGQREGTADDGAGGQTLGWPRLAHSMNLILWHTHIVDRQQCTVELVSFSKRCPERRKAGVPGEKLPPLVSSWSIATRRRHLAEPGLCQGKGQKSLQCSMYIKDGFLCLHFFFYMTQIENNADAKRDIFYLQFFLAVC